MSKNGKSLLLQVHAHFCTHSSTLAESGRERLSILAAWSSLLQSSEGMHYIYKC